MQLNLLYYMGLCLVILYLMMGFDDFIWDITTVFKQLMTKKDKLDLNEVSKTPYKLLAVMIAAWHEESVLEDVVDNFILSTVYPKSMYHIFLGVYPNDSGTIEVAQRLAKKHENVHVVINNLAGPTSKAQNINYVIKQILEFEKIKNWKFSSFTVHDSEDVVHPYELKVTNFLIEKYPALQFPVFPIIYKPTFKNFFKALTSSTYADEFAENHFIVIKSRNDSGAFVPSAGTGFALSRRVIDSFGDEDILENGCLTEDYKLSLTLYKKNIALHYVLERMPRVTDDYKIVWDYIATRSIFPNTFKTAVRQKTRWITGITMQSLRFKEIFKFKKMPFVAKYSLYRDQKAKVGNLLAFIGYPVFVYFIASLFIDLPIIYPKYTLSWYLLLIVTISMIERQLFRGIAIYNIYGLKNVFFSCLLPPIVPIRIVWGNIINFVSTVKAYRRRLFGDPKPKNQKTKINNNKKEIKWDKTEHSFLSKSILKRYHRKIGDILLEKKIITPENLKRCLINMENLKTKPILGQYLLNTGIITEEQLLLCISDTLNKVYIRTNDFSGYNTTDLINTFNLDELKKYVAIPIIKTDDRIVIAIGVNTPIKFVKSIQDKCREKVEFCFATSSSIIKGLSNISRNDDLSFSLQMLKQKRINFEQVLLVNNTALELGLSQHKTMVLMGLETTINSINQADTNILNKEFELTCV